LEAERAATYSMTTAETVQDLPAIEMFANLEASERAALASEFETLNLTRGDVLMRQGELADALYVVVSGRFAVTVEGRRGTLTEIGPGQPVGEIAFLSGGTRTATVTAMRDGIVLRLGRDDFDRLSERHPAIWRAMTVTLARRLATTTAARVPPPDPRPRTIAVIRAGGRPVPGAFVELLAKVFTRHARTLVMGAAGASALCNGHAISSAEATRALNAIESAHDYILFIADPDLTDWSEKVIRHADLVLAVGLHASDMTPSPLERRAAELLPADMRRLVLLHPTRTKVLGTSRWLSAREVAMHHHVALDTEDDVERLYRFISGTALGFVACGGGALCAAHIGVHQALVECGIVVDVMGGTSGGSAMTAAFAQGYEPSQIDQALHDMFVANRAMHRYTLPRYSLLDHRHFDQQLARHFGGPDIEDLWIPYFAVSTNLSSYALHRHHRGDLWTAVRASSSIPVLLPPVYTRDGQMLVDGCLLDNVPVRIMHELKSGPNIVVSFDIPELERFDVDYPALPSRAELIKAALNPLRRSVLPPAPGLSTVLMRSLMANRQDFMRHMRPDDMLLVPPIPQDMGLLDWHRHSELKELAYRWTREEIARRRAGGAPAARNG
jgi:NTE family protein